LNGIDLALFEGNKELALNSRLLAKINGCIVAASAIAFSCTGPASPELFMNNAEIDNLKIILFTNNAG
jgi:hypothetical protein